MELPLEAIEHDIRKLADAIRSGELCVDHSGEPLSERVDEAEAHVLAGEIVRYLIGSESFSLAFKIICSKTWLDTAEAMLYSTLDSRQLKELAENREITGRKKGEGRTSSWVFNRLSLDEWLSRSKIERDAKYRAAGLAGAGKLGG